MSSKWASVAKRIVPRAMENVIACIGKPPDQRRTTEIEMILPWFRKKSDLLRSVDKQVLIEIIRGCKYRNAVRNDVIIKQGDIGDCFYIMLTGKTSVYIDTTKSDDEPNPSESSDAKKEVLVTAVSALSGLKKSSLTTVRDRSTLGKFIISFGDGKSFGEIALISEDSVRNASIVADEHTDLLIVHRDLFNSTLKAKQEEEYKERKDFVDNNPLFRNWSTKFKRLLEMSLRKETLPFDTHIVTQGQPVVGLHFILKGQAKVVVEPDKHRRQFPRMFDVVNIYDFSNGNSKDDKGSEARVKEHVTQSHIRVRRKQGYAAAERRLAHKRVHLCSVEENEVIGDIEMVFDMPTYLQTVICTSNTEVMILDNKNYERLLTKKNPQTIEQMRNTMEIKLKGKLKSSNGIQVPLFKNVIEKIENAKPKKNQSVNEDLSKEEELYAQLVDLYLNDKVSSILDPAVPNAIFYRYKTVQKRRAKEAWEKRMKSAKQTTSGRSFNHESRLTSARMGNKRQPRSRRELQNITIGPPPKTYGTRPRTAPPRINRPDEPVENSENKTFITEVNGGSYTENEIVSANYSVDTVPQIQEQGSSSSFKFIQNGRQFSPPMATENEEDAYFDMETSNGVLSDLEHRLHAFHARMTEGERRKATRITELKRFVVHDSSTVPIPGGTVYVKTKPCKYNGRSSRTTTTGDDRPLTHEHVRRFMLPKNTSLQGTDINTKISLHMIGFNNNSEDSNSDSRPESPAVERQYVRRPRPSTAGARLGVSAN